MSTEENKALVRRLFEEGFSKLTHAQVAGAFDRYYVTSLGSSMLRRITNHTRAPGNPARTTLTRTNAKSQMIGPLLSSLMTYRRHRRWGIWCRRASTRCGR
jgi:hypothetical protein